MSRLRSDFTNKILNLSHSLYCAFYNAPQLLSALGSCVPAARLHFRGLLVLSSIVGVVPNFWVDASPRVRRPIVELPHIGQSPNKSCPRRTQNWRGMAFVYRCHHAYPRLICSFSIHVAGQLHHTRLCRLQRWSDRALRLPALWKLHPRSEREGLYI